MKNKRIKIISCFVFLFLWSFCFPQDTIKKVVFKAYPSLNASYGVGFYRTQTGNYKDATHNYWNNNYNLGAQINGYLRFKNDFGLEIYVAYNKWNYADLFPVGILLKPKINNKKDEMYFKVGGGYSFGKCYYDRGRKFDYENKKIFPKDLGDGNFHLKLGLEKNYNFNKRQSVSLGMEFLFQGITYYYFQGGGPGSMTSDLRKGTTMYKFGGLTLAYHFY